VLCVVLASLFSSPSSLRIDLGYILLHHFLRSARADSNIFGFIQDTLCAKIKCPSTCSATVDYDVECSSRNRDLILDQAISRTNTVEDCLRVEDNRTKKSISSLFTSRHLSLFHIDKVWLQYGTNTSSLLFPSQFYHKRHVLHFNQPCQTTSQTSQTWEKQLNISYPKTIDEQLDEHYFPYRFWILIEDSTLLIETSRFFEHLAQRSTSSPSTNPNLLLYVR